MLNRCGSFRVSPILSLTPSRARHNVNTMKSSHEAPVLTRAEKLRALLSTAKAHVPAYQHELWARREAVRAERRRAA